MERRAWFQVGRLVREGRTKRPEGSDPVAGEAMERVRRIARLACRDPMIGFIVRHRDRPCPAYVVLVGRMRGQRLRDGGGQQRQENGRRNRRNLAADAFEHETGKRTGRLRRCQMVTSRPSEVSTTTLCTIGTSEAAELGL